MNENSITPEIEKEAKQLKRNLEQWREVILLINSVLLWEKSIYLGVILCTSTISFFLLWHMDPGTVTIFSVMGILITALDYLVPVLSPHFCHPEKWTSAKERKLDSICNNLAVHKIVITRSIKSFYKKRQDHPKQYYMNVILTLTLLSLIGNSVNNTFLTYLIVTSLLLVPGFQKHEIISKYRSKVTNFLRGKSGLMQNMKKSD